MKIHDFLADLEQVSKDQWCEDPIYNCVGRQVLLVTDNSAPHMQPQVAARLSEKYEMPYSMARQIVWINDLNVPWKRDRQLLDLIFNNVIVSIKGLVTP